MKTLREAVAALEQELDVVVALRRFYNADTEATRGLTCPVAQYMQEAVGEQVYVSGRRAWVSGRPDAAIILPQNIVHAILQLDHEAGYDFIPEVM